jgi:hypothetical protein
MFKIAAVNERGWVTIVYLRHSPIPESRSETHWARRQKNAVCRKHIARISDVCYQDMITMMSLYLRGRRANIVTMTSRVKHAQCVNSRVSNSINHKIVLQECSKEDTQNDHSNPPTQTTFPNRHLRSNHSRARELRDSRLLSGHCARVAQVQETYRHGDYRGGWCLGFRCRGG